MGHTFISYAREDRAKVSALGAALEQHGLTVWIDDRLEAGAHYDFAIEQALAEADKVIVAWSPAASASSWVRAEAGDGLERGILVPILIEATRIPLEFRRLQTVDLTDWAREPNSAVPNDLLAALNAQGRRLATPDTRVPQDRLPDKQSTVSAEVLGINKFVGNVRMRVLIGGKHFSVEHASRLLYQVIKVDGYVVHRSRFGLYHEHHAFVLLAPDGEHSADLFLKGDNISGFSGVLLNIDGQEVLREKVGWKDGLVSFLVFLYFLLGAAYFVATWFGPTLFGVLAFGIIASLLAFIWVFVG